ncbi:MULTISPECIES: DUF4184 family protein [unclassified Nocardia]|uniref:DUF4184 family protein n=1 Tax=unclassified Nocardia TaxID=2637762 RepID=UPI0024A8E0B3|nr:MULTISPECIES: DUF4184 family protein [unclassified Nocardia]
MPFTLAHPAAVLPLRRYAAVPALVAGALAPDVPYYLPWPGDIPRTHTPVGLLGWDLFFGLALLAVLRVVAVPLLALSPLGWRRRITLPRWKIRSVGGAVAVVLAVWLGAATHLVWDAFTQTGGPAVQRWEWLRVAVAEPHRLYNVLGYLSSVGGMVVLSLAAVRWYRRTPPGRAAVRGVPPRAVPLIVSALAAATAAGAGFALMDPVARVSDYDLVRLALLGGVRGCALGVLAYALGWWLVVSGRPDQARSPRTGP